MTPRPHWQGLFDSVTLAEGRVDGSAAAQHSSTSRETKDRLAVPPGVQKDQGQRRCSQSISTHPRRPPTHPRRPPTHPRRPPTDPRRPPTHPQRPLTQRRPTDSPRLRFLPTDPSPQAPLGRLAAQGIPPTASLYLKWYQT
ncbi:uncharacterized protein LOC144525902 [Sander vitreus]